MSTVSLPKLAEIGYTAYSNTVDNKNYAGDEMPTWKDLPEQQRIAWGAAADAISSAFNRFLIEAAQES